MNDSIAKILLDTKRCAASKGEQDDLTDDKRPAYSLQIVVKRLGARSEDISVDIDSAATVLDLKKLISVQLEAENEFVPPNRQRLIYFGRMLRDDKECLGEYGVNMKADTVNYVHFSPLPKGAEPSERTAGQPFTVGSPHVDLEGRLERARRLGTARRERRRRRRQEPYPVAASRSAATPSATESESRANPQQEGREPVAYAQQISPPASSYATVAEPIATPATQRLPSPFAQAPATAEQITRLSATFAAAARQAEATTSWLTTQFRDRDRQAAAELVPSLSLLHDRLHRFDAFSADEEVNMLETLRLLDHVSRESANLATTLRTSLLARSQLSASLVSSNQVSLATVLEQLLRENARTLLVPEERRVHPLLEQLQRMLQE